MLQLLDKTIIDATSARAKESPRLRMNYNFHPSLDDKVQRFINCMEPGTQVGIHHHPVDETLIVIRGAVKAILVDDDKNVIDAKAANTSSSVPRPPSRATKASAFSSIICLRSCRVAHMRLTVFAG